MKTTRLSKAKYILSICSKFSLYSILFLSIFTISFTVSDEAIAQKPELTITEVFTDYDSQLIEIMGSTLI